MRQTYAEEPWSPEATPCHPRLLYLQQQHDLAATEQGLVGSLLSLEAKKGVQVRKVMKVGQPLQSVQEPVPLEIHVFPDCSYQSQP